MEQHDAGDTPCAWHLLFAACTHMIRVASAHSPGTHLARKGRRWVRAARTSTMHAAGAPAENRLRALARRCKCASVATPVDLKVA